MKIIESHTNQCTCDNCGSLLKYEGKDLHWSHTESTCYYLICPKCKSFIWLRANKRLDDLWKLNNKNI